MAQANAGKRDFDAELAANEADRERIQREKREHYQAEAQTIVNQVAELLKPVSDYLTGEQRSQLLKVIGAKPAKAEGKTGGKSGGPTKAVTPKYQLPNGGLTWAGRGPAAPKQFQIWADSAEGKKWRRENNKGAKLPDGVTWDSFPAFSQTEEGKKFITENQIKLWPDYQPAQ